MRQDKALAAEVAGILGGLDDPVVSDDPFAWSDTPEDRRRRSAAMEAIGERLGAFVYRPRGARVAKLAGFGTVLPLALLLLVSVVDFVPAPNPRVFVQLALALTAVGFGIGAAAVWAHPRIDESLALAAYTTPREWSFSRRNGRRAWDNLVRRFSYFDRGDEDQALTDRVWGYLDEERRRPFMMFVFYWIDVEIRTSYNAATKSVQTKTERVPRQRHGMFVAMPESRSRIRVTEVGDADRLDKSVRLEYAALNRAVDVYCRASEELAARRFLSPAVQEILLEMSRDVDGLHLDFYPGFVLVASRHEFLDGAPSVRVDADVAAFAAHVAPWIARVEKTRGYLGEAVRRIGKYND